MITYSNALDLLQKLTKVSTSDTTNSNLLITFWNDSRRTVASIRGGNWPWREIEETVQTVADQDYVYIPNDMARVTAVRVTVGTGTSATIYLPKLIFDEQKWQLILAYRLGSNQYPYYCFQQGQKLKFAPIPSDTGTNVTLLGRRAIRDVNIADLTNVTVATATTNLTTLVLSGSMTADMVGRYIRITQTTADNGGDGYWYKIGSFTSATQVDLEKPYQGLSIVAGTAACTIGQITYEPEAYQMAPIYRATWQWLQLNDPTDNVRWEAYAKLYDGGSEAGLIPSDAAPGGLIGQMLEEAGETFDGHYMSPSDKDSNGYSGVPYWFPLQDASGFN